MDVAELGIRIDGVDGVWRAKEAIDKFTDSGKDAEETYTKLPRELDKTNKGIEKTGKDADTAARRVKNLASALAPIGGVLAAAFSTRALVGYVDTWSDLTSRVNLSIGAHEDAADVMSRLSDIARMTYSDFQSTAESFTANSTTLRALGKDTQGMLNYTEALNNALVVSGAKADRAQMVQNSLSKAMAEGTLRGEELNNVLNSGSRIAEILAEELGTDITQLRGLAKDGKITGDIIYNSLVKNMETLAEEAASMPATISDAFTLIRNAILESVGVFDQAGGLSESLAESLVEISDIIRDTDWSPYINALVLAAKVGGVYLVAVNAIPVATLAAATATKAYQLVLANFTVQAAMTTKQLLSMRTALNLVAAAFVGWEIGKYLRNEFEIVEKFGIALMSGLHQSAVWIGGEFKVLGANVEYALTNPLSAARHALANYLELLSSLGRGAMRAVGLEGLADGVEGVIDRLRGTAARNHQETLAGIRRDTRREMEGISDIYFDMFSSVGKVVEETGSKISDVLEDNAKKTDQLTDAQKRLKEAIRDELTALERAAITWGMNANEVKLYDLALMGATDTQLMHARTQMELVERYERGAEAQRNYLQLVKDLRTDEEKLTDQMRERLTVLTSMENLTPQEYSHAAGRIASESFTKPPEFGGLAPEIGGPFGELAKVDEATEKLNLWYETQLERLAMFREEQSALNSQWDEQEEALHQQHQDRLLKLDRARQVAQLSAAESVFGSLSGLTRAFAGEQSTLYKTMFVAQKAFSVGSVFLSGYEALAKAWASAPFPFNLPAVATTAAETGVLQAAVSSVSMNGFYSGGYTGGSSPSDVMGVVHGQEYVFDAATTSRIGVDNLDSIRSGRTPVGGGLKLVVNNNVRGAEILARESTDGNGDPQYIIDVVSRDMVNGGATADAVASITGTQYQGS